MNRFLQLGINKKGRDFVIGDIHGKYTQLMYQLDQYAFDFEKDRLFAVGDLIDRGTENMECLELIGEPWFFTTLGNHELMMFDGIINGGHTQLPYGQDLLRFWTGNGGMWFFNLDDDDVTKLREQYCPLIWEHLPVAIEFIAENGKRVGITHAGLPKAWTWDQTRLHLQNIKDLDDKVVQECVWTRSRIQGVAGHGCASDILGIDLLINGHTPTKDPVWVGNNVFIDQGANNPYTWEPYRVIDLFDEMDVEQGTEDVNIPYHLLKMGEKD